MQGPSKEELEDAYLDELLASAQAEQVTEMENDNSKFKQDDGCINLGPILQINKK